MSIPSSDLLNTGKNGPGHNGPHFGNIGHNGPGNTSIGSEKAP